MPDVVTTDGGKGLPRRYQAGADGSFSDPVRLVDISGWQAESSKAAAIAHEELLEAPGEGLAYVITEIVVTNDDTAAIAFTLEEDPAVAADVVFGGSGGHKIPVSSMLVYQPKVPIRLAANKALGYTVVGAGKYTVTVGGYTEDVS